MQALGRQQRREQGVLVFAVAVLVVQNVGSCVRLVAAQPERQAYVAEILGDVVIESLDPVEIAAQAFGQLVGLRANLRSGLPAIVIEARVPAADFFPAVKGGQLNRRNFIFGLFLFPLLFVFVLILVVVLALQVGTGPAIDAPAILLADLRVKPRLGLQLQGTIAGYVDFELLVEIDVGPVEIVLSPELARRERRVDDRGHVILQDLPRPQTRHGDVFLSVVGIDRRLACNRRAEVLYGIRRRRYHAAIFLQYAHVGNLHAFVRGVVAEQYLSPLPDPGLALHPDPRRGFLPPRAVTLEAETGTHLFDDERLLGIILLFPRRPVGRLIGGRGGGWAFRLLGNGRGEEAGKNKGEVDQTAHNLG